MTSIVKVDELTEILTDVEMMKGRQENVDNMLENMKRENEALWREVAMLRQKHLKQQQIVEKLLSFLASIVRNRVVPAGIKRKAPLLIEQDPDQSNAKLSKSDTPTTMTPSQASGPIIHDITDIEENMPTSVTSDHSLLNEANQLSQPIANNDFQFVQNITPDENNQILNTTDEDALAMSLPDNLLDFGYLQDSLDDQCPLTTASDVLNTPTISQASPMPSNNATGLVMSKQQPSTSLNIDNNDCPNEYL